VSLESTSLRLRQFGKDDAAIVEEWLNGWEGLSRFRDRTLVWNLDDVSSHFDDTRTLMIEEKASGAAIGLARLGDFDSPNRRVELEIHLIPEKRSQGMSSEVGILMLHYAFAFLNVAKVVIRTFETNIHAMAAAEKHEFRKEGVLRKHIQRGGRRLDVIFWGLLEEEYWASAGLADLRERVLPGEATEIITKRR
jgi:[ribosomal protein S5]-alanine N-acetyltransferase